MERQRNMFIQQALKRVCDLSWEPKLRLSLIRVLRVFTEAVTDYQSAMQLSPVQQEAYREMLSKREEIKKDCPEDASTAFNDLDVEYEELLDTVRKQNIANDVFLRQEDDLSFKPVTIPEDHELLSEIQAGDFALLLDDVLIIGDSNV